eukprot:CAMPEP_0115612584 /NCGR_PEP_ID=MMETSP0272-20121206/21129_1 /TAXON_ID=71861 /ORGANISM="Scrippsiella trochoidea, Strain CCMP3099" /LENGTH=166 /DNA_ID=CAMNT_0003048363 /DNA_START=654 /DNA_END=1151 /DNA_ORIENTATION=+
MPSSRVPAIAVEVWPATNADAAGNPSRRRSPPSRQSGTAAELTTLTARGASRQFALPRSSAKIQALPTRAQAEAGSAGAPPHGNRAAEELTAGEGAPDTAGPPARLAVPNGTKPTASEGGKAPPSLMHTLCTATNSTAAKSSNAVAGRRPGMLIMVCAARGLQPKG